MESSRPREGTPRAAAAPRRGAHVLATAATLGVALLAFASHAQAGERWLLIPVHANDQAQALDAAALTRGLEAELRGAGQTLLPNDTAAGLFETQQSSEPVQLGSDELRRLSRSVHQAARHLALGELPDAQRAMEAVHALSEPARDYLNRETARARKIFDNCLMAAYLWERGAQHQPALAQMVECARGFPAFGPDGRAYPTEVLRLFEAATLQLSQREPPASLRVLGVGRDGCRVRLNGIEVGKSPAQLAELRAGATRVQLECEPGVVGRIHHRELARGDNELSIDPLFDAAVHSRGGLWLAYATERERDQRAADDALAIGRALGVERVVLLWSSPGALGHDIAVRPLGAGPARELARASYAADSGYARGGASKLASTLVGWARAQSTPNQVESVGDVIAEPKPSAPAAPAPESSAAHSPPSAAQPAASGGPAAPRYTQQHAAAGAILAVVGGASMAASWVAYGQRQPKRKAGKTTQDRTTYSKLGVVALSTVTVGATLVSLSEYFWLPDDPGIPASAWVAGGLGLGVGVAAVALSLTASDCRLGDGRVSCQTFWADHYFGPILALHSIPLLTVPLWYWLRAVFRPAHVQLTLTTHLDGMPQLRLGGEF